MLEVGDGALRVGKGGVEMSEGVCRGPVCRGPVFRSQRGRRGARRQGGADLALGQVEAFPDAIAGAFAEPFGGADGGGDAGGGAFEELPQAAGAEAEASDLVGKPDAEGPATAGPSIAVAAKAAAGAERPSRRSAVVKAVQEAVANQRADHLAVRTGRLLEPFGNRLPLLIAAVKPSLLAHVGDASAKIAILAEGEERGSGVRFVILERGTIPWTAFTRLPVQETSAARMANRQPPARNATRAGERTNTTAR